MTKWRSRAKDFAIGFIAISVIAVFAIVVHDKAEGAVVTSRSSVTQQVSLREPVPCGPTCQKNRFINQKIAAFNAGDLGRTPDAIWERGEIKQKIHQEWNRIGGTAKQRMGIAKDCDFGCWWTGFKAGASCAVIHNTDSCIKTATGNFADDFVSLWNGAVDVGIRCAIPIAVGVALTPNKPWMGGGAGGATCFWAWYYDKTHD